ncbi:Leucine-rich repeat [Macleaya cordata]|uniref:Leucine-rich repeat n=1 Tax=Macleaya cordata TaxID=56857 RepID=A0A200Q3Y8_MACCD|nr:Leucine-rich repeat [Macleaya cordata]
MAQVLATIVSEALINKLISIASQEIDLVWGVKGELTKLRQTFIDIKAVLNDADKKQVENKAIQIWLRDLKDIAYDAEDVLDDFQYEALRHELESQGRIRNKVRNSFSISNNPFVFRRKIAHKIKDINQMLDEIARRKSMLQLTAESTVIDNGSRIQEEELIRFRRIRLFFDNEFAVIPEVMYKAKKLRTFVSSTPRFRKEMVENVPDHIFLNLSYLRVLDLSRTAIKELPPSVGKLKHLRYLDLSFTRLTSLPDSVTCIYNLQTLRLRLCSQLKELPRDLRKLINLRHLVISKCRDGWTQMPSEVGKLSRLQTLKVFIVGKDNGYGIEELKGLNLLRGRLEIHNLENVRDGIDAKGATLMEKQNICHLKLNWNKSDNRNVIVDDYAVLEGLQPHRNLKSLVIKNFLGLEFPTWMMRASSCLPNLVSVFLKNCDKCEHLPTFGQLPFLKSLSVQKMNAVNSIGSEFYGSNEEATTRVAAPYISFPSLEELYLDEMPNLEEWLEQLSSSSSFPCLKKLFIYDCIKLEITPTLFPSLKKLDFRESNGMPVRSLVASNLTSLTSILIISSHDLIFLPQGLLQGNSVLRYLSIDDCSKFEAFLPNQEEVPLQVLSSSSLETIEIINCPSLKSVPDLRGLNALRYLQIRGCKRLESLPDGLQFLTALEKLKIGAYSEELESLPFPAIGEGTDQCLVSLRELRIHGWSQLNSLPDQLQYLTSLQELRLYNFPSLVALPEWFGNLASLHYLDIRWCENLMYLPSQEQMRRLTALRTLRLEGCCLLEDRCSGEESHKIAHIPHLLRTKNIVYS